MEANYLSRIFGPPIRSDVIQPIGRVVDPDKSYAAVQDIASQYNESGNPGRFTVVQDRQYTHIQQTLHKVNGSLQPFEPFSNTVLKWQWKSGSCHQVLSDLINALAQQHEIGIAQGNLPVGSLYMHHCDIEGSSASGRQVLEALVTASMPT